MHCDALTQTGKRQVTKENLQAGECALQCFAAFVSSREDRFFSALSLCDRFDELIAREGYCPVRSASDFAEGELCAMLTVEEGGAIEGSLEKLRALYARGRWFETTCAHHLIFLPREIKSKQKQRDWPH